MILSPATKQLCRLTDSIMVACQQGDQQESLRLLDAQKRLFQRLMQDRVKDTTRRRSE